MTYAPDPDRRPIPWQVVVALAAVILIAAVVTFGCAAIRAVI